MKKFKQGQKVRVVFEGWISDSFSDGSNYEVSLTPAANKFEDNVAWIPEKFILAVENFQNEVGQELLKETSV